MQAADGGQATEVPRQRHLQTRTYIPPLYRPRVDLGESAKGMLRGKLGPRRFRYATQRFHPTVLHAVAAGIKPKTLNAFDALSVYGDRFAATAAYHILKNTLRATGAGKWGTRAEQKAGKIPADWVELAPQSQIFRTEHAFVDQQGNARTAHEMLFVPPVIQKAMKPILDPDYFMQHKGVEKTQAYQTAIKPVELGMSVFHLHTCLELTSLYNQGPVDTLLSHLTPMDSPEFEAAERVGSRFGLTTPIMGHTAEVHERHPPPPTLMERFRGLPGIKQASQLAAGISHLTFDDIVQRKFKVVDFTLPIHAGWLNDHPKASSEEQSAAGRSIARQINDTYGGFNWEALGVSRTWRNIARLAFLAPDWFFSNFLNVKQAFEGGPGEEVRPVNFG